MSVAIATKPTATVITSKKRALEEVIQKMQAELKTVEEEGLGEIVAAFIEKATPARRLHVYNTCANNSPETFMFPTEAAAKEYVAKNGGGNVWGDVVEERSLLVLAKQGKLRAQ